jgi:type IV pilus assembly protein PilY1
LSTQVAGPTSPTPGYASRVMLTWDTTNNVGIPFEYTNLNANQQATLDAFDGTTAPETTSTRLNYLRGQRTNEVSSGGAGLYRPRSSLLSDIVDSSPTWVGPPISPYATTWTDRLQSTDSML